MGARDARAEEGRGLIPVVFMWQQVGIHAGNLERRPRKTEMIAAAFRQLLRAYEADDPIAVTLETITFCMKLHTKVDFLLRDEPSWDSKSRWLDSFSTSQVFFLPPDRVRVRAAMHWGLKSNIAGRFWSEPFDVQLQFRPDLSEVVSSRIRFGDLRPHPGDLGAESCERVVREIDSGTVEWRFDWEE